METVFRWLHLSDLHWDKDGKDAVWGEIHPALIRDLERLREQFGGGAWDAVFFTGDLVTKSSPAQFSDMNQWLEKLRDVIGGNPVFLSVPGNHDLERPDKEDDGLLLLQGSQQAALGKLKNKQENAVRKTLDRAFSQYAVWQKTAVDTWPGQSDLRNYKANGLLPGDFATTIVEKGGLKIGIVGLNSAFLQLAAGDYRGKLALLSEQLTHLLGRYPGEWANKHHLSFLLTHHDEHWLSPESSEVFRDTIAPPDRFALHLSGHQHEPFSESNVQGGHSGARNVTIASSLSGVASYRVYRAGKGEQREDRIHGYSAGCLVLEPDQTLAIRLFPRRAEKKQGGGWEFEKDRSYRLEPDEGCTIRVKSKLALASGGRLGGEHQSSGNSGKWR